MVEKAWPKKRSLETPRFDSRTGALAAAPYELVLELGPLLGQRNDFDGLRPFLALLDLILHALVFLQRSKSLGFDPAVVRENVAAAIVGLDETEALGLVEPLYNACGHSKLFMENAGSARGAQAMSPLDVAEWPGGSTAAELRRKERKNYTSLSTWNR